MLLILDLPVASSCPVVEGELLHGGRDRLVGNSGWWHVCLPSKLVPPSLPPLEGGTFLTLPPLFPSLPRKEGGGRRGEGCSRS